MFHVSLAANAGTDSAWAKIENWSCLWNSGVGNKKPLIDYYKAKGILKEVDGTVDMKDVFAAITDILGE